MISTKRLWMLAHMIALLHSAPVTWAGSASGTRERAAQCMDANPGPAAGQCSVLGQLLGHASFPSNNTVRELSGRG